MVLEMKIPSPGESITEVEIAQWLVKDGDYVEKDQPIAEVDSDKATLELPAEISGVVTIKVKEGDTVAVGEIACLIDPSGTPNENTSKKETVSTPVENQTANDISENKSTATTYATGEASPAAKKIIAEKNIPTNTIKGTGKDGRITKADVINAVPAMGTAPEWKGERNSTQKKMSLLRRKIADRLVSVKNETAMLTTFNEVDMSYIFKVRNQHKESFEKKHGVKLGFMSFFTKAVIRALKLYPAVNSMIDGDNMVTFDYYDISIAVSGSKGLVVPVIRSAEQLSFSGIEKEIIRLATRARDGVITVDEMTGGTFTISNGGIFGSMLSTPILNPPQSGILGMHNILQRPIAVDGKVEIRPMMYLALSYDHRIIDGKESVGFLLAVKEALEKPEELLMDNNIESALEL